MTAPRALLLAAQRANALLDAAYDGKMTGVVMKDAMSRNGVDALLVDEGLGDGDTLVLPGTGYGSGPHERWTDWWRNIVSQVPGREVRRVLDPAAIKLPQQGESGYRWASGFLKGAEQVIEWLGDRNPVRACGHSQGGAILQIVSWSRWRYHRAWRPMDAHAIAPARVVFEEIPQPPSSLHCWIAPDDHVPRVPFGYHHIGEVHELPRCGEPGWLVTPHKCQSYGHRFTQALAGCQG